MTYADIHPGVFLDRPSRFIANVRMEGRVEPCHIKNTGRCRELLLPGARCFVQRAANADRRTRYDLVSIYKGDTLVNIDSVAPNKVFHEWVAQSDRWGQVLTIRPESRWGSSRFDFYLETDQNTLFVEVKGVTLEEAGVARFLDAPTARGVKHVRELIACREAGHHAAVAFIIPMQGVHAFMPSDRIDPAFGQALREAAAQGVEVLAMDCHVTPDSLRVDGFVPVDLS